MQIRPSAVITVQLKQVDSGSCLSDAALVVTSDGPPAVAVAVAATVAVMLVAGSH
jgi:hypothetical protein